MLVAVIAIVVNGVKTNIWLNGGTEDESVGHYIFRSVLPLAIIAGTPTMMGFVTTSVNYLVNDLMLGSTGIDYGKVLSVLVLMQSNPFTQIVSIVGMIMVIYYTITVLYQCVKRQVQLSILSIIGPAVAATTVSENNAGDFMTLLKEMFGIGVITALQLAMLLSAIALPATEAFSIIPGVGQPFVIVGIFAAVKHVPRWIERYALAPSVSGQGGAGRVAMMAAGMGARSAITKAVR